MSTRRTRSVSPALISVTAPNRPGSLAEIANVIGQAGGNIDNLKMLRRASDFTELRIGLEVWDLNHLNQIIAGLKSEGRGQQGRSRV